MSVQIELFEPSFKADLEHLEFLPEGLESIESDLYPDLESISFEDVAEIEAYFEATKRPRPRYRRSFQQMLNALGEFESGKKTGDPNQYKVENTLGFMGKYQFGEALLIDLGYYKANVYYSKGANKNYWRGTWTGKKGIRSKAQFLNSRRVQEFAIREAFALNFQRIKNTLEQQGKSINNFLGKRRTYRDRGKSRTIKITLSGILAGAHLRGAGGVAQLLLNNKVSHDEYGTSILKYIHKYGGYRVTLRGFLRRR